MNKDKKKLLKINRTIKKKLYKITKTVQKMENHIFEFSDD